jgi:hypothetical protein
VSVTVIMRDGNRFTVTNAAQWSFTPGTIELQDGNGCSVASFLREHAVGSASNDEQQPEDEEERDIGFK